MQQNNNIKQSTNGSSIYGIEVLEKNNFANLTLREIRKLKLINENDLRNSFIKVVMNNTLKKESENNTLIKIFNLFA